METKDLLIELGTEELPPTALLKLSSAFGDDIRRQLEEHKLGFESIKYYATPRRLAVLVEQLQARQQDQEVEKKGPALKAAFDADGNPTRAAEGFARSVGVAVDQLERKETEKGTWLVYNVLERGVTTVSLIPGFIETSLNRLPIPKRMRWGSRKVQFVRPAHWLVVMFGEEVLPCTILDQESSNLTRGHRFHGEDVIKIDSPSSYANNLEQKGSVIADYNRRREMIRQQVEALASSLGGIARIDDDLLDEVTGLVELPTALGGKFDEHFLDVPHEALIYAMKDHQKYFPVFDQSGKLMPFFITVSNLQSKDPAQVVAGNERVIRPRLADAKFFFETDQQKTLEQHNQGLEKVVFQNQLGTVFEKEQRIAAIAGFIASQTGGDPEWAQQAGKLCKADLCTDMVGEFDSMQGTMAYYLARHEAMNDEIALAFKEQYLPKFAGDTIPATDTGAAISISDKLDTIVGIFGIGQKPTGEKDPYGLRRATLGVLRIIIEKEYNLDLEELIKLAVDLYGDRLTNNDVSTDVFDFMQSRYRARYQEQGIQTDTILSVLALSPGKPLDFHRRIKAVEAFRKMPEAKSLAEANKRVGNILSKAEGWQAGSIDQAILAEEAEKALSEKLAELENQTLSLFEASDYERALATLATSQAVIDRFFDDVMVMAEDEAMRNNRLNLLNAFRQLFMQVADISELQS